MTVNRNNAIKSKWWGKTIRNNSWFSFRYWWFNYLVWAVLISLLLFFILKKSPTDSVFNCPQKASIDSLIVNIRRDLDQCCNCSKEVASPPIKEPTPPPVEDTRPKGPTENCRVHFSGLFMGGDFLENHISKIYQADYASEYVGSGEYKSNKKAFPKAVARTFDGIAIDRGTRLIIYSKENFKGTVVLDVKGPAIINNVLFKDDPRYNHCNTDTYSGDLQRNYPQSVRKWSKTNMQTWSSGSCKITCE
jgi:hypothetical protein